MTLALVPAPATGVEKRDNGLIVIRCEDYVGAARAGLSTVSDSLSVAGTVVKEEQALAVATNNTQAGVAARWTAAADTLAIPIADIAPHVSTTPVSPSLSVFVGLKVLGDVPSNARRGKTWAGYTDAGASAGMAWGRDTTLLTSEAVHGAVWDEQYKFTNSLFSWSTISGNTNLVLKAWGITGGDIEQYFDVVYLWPSNANDLATIFTLSYFPTNFKPFDVGADGTFLVDQDQDDTDNILGEQSSTAYGGTNAYDFHAISSFADGQGDHQESNDEPTLYDVNAFGAWDGSNGTPVDPKSRLVVATGSVYIPETLVVDDDFSSVSSPGLPNANHLLDGPQGYHKFNGLGFSVNHSSGFQGWRQDASQLRCLYGPNQNGGTPAAFWPHGDWCLGNYAFAFGATPTDPRLFWHTLDGMEDSIQEFTFEIVGSDTILLFGFANFSRGVPAIVERHYGVEIELTGAGVLQATLGFMNRSTFITPTGTGLPWYPADGPTTINGSYGGEVYRIKFEKLRYTWRIKIWDDSGSEPGSWTIESHMPIVYTSGFGSIGQGIVEYSYLTNWPGDVLHDTAVYAPYSRTDLGFYPAMTAWPTITANPETEWIIENYTLTVNDRGGSPDDTQLAEEKYDFTGQSNSLTIPWGSHRMVESDLIKRHFNADVNGYNLLAWKDSGAAEFQGPVILWVAERGVDTTFIPQIYRLVIF
jgi:hypothetical protein